jgi:hypothetical protein
VEEFSGLNSSYQRVTCAKSPHPEQSDVFALFITPRAGDFAMVPYPVS